jgi:acid phosphatase type 7
VAETLTQVVGERQSRVSAALWKRRTSARRACAGPLAALLALLAISAACGGSSNPGAGPTPTPSPTPTPTPTPPGPPPTEPVLVGAGDIALCPGGAQEATAQLLDRIGGTVFTLGDNVYDGATMQKYTECYGPSWGRHLARTRPSPGNHDYEPPGPQTYFSYFGAAAGEEGTGYYSYDIAAWHVISLNSLIDKRPGSSQALWLESDLASNAARCTVAYFHFPLFSSAQNGPHASVRDLWRLLYDHGVDVILSGDDHVYERFAPQDPEGRADSARGIRQFTVGTGGATLYGFGTPAANSEVRASVHGVLKLLLQSSGYSWEFVPVAGQTFRDSGSGSCH